MNTIVMPLNRELLNPASEFNQVSLGLPLSKIRFIFLLASIVFSAMALIYVKDLNRRLFINYQNLQSLAHQLEVKQGKYMLEASMLSTPTRVQQVAVERWQMHVPVAKDTILLEIP